MNKQVVIAGLLGAIAAADDDAMPCTDFVTDRLTEAKAEAEAVFDSWNDKIEGLEDNFDDTEEELETAEDAYGEVVDAVVPFYEAVQTAYEDWQDAANAKSAAQDMLDAIEDNAVNTISGEHMLLGEAAPQVATMWADVESAQEAYDTKKAEIDGLTFLDADSATETGFRAYLAEEIKTQALMEDAEDVAGDAETLAINNYQDQEAVVNALLTIEGCSLVTNADLTTGEEAAIIATTEVAADEELIKYEVCCNTRLKTYLVAESHAEDCSTNVGFGMELQRDTYNTDRATQLSNYETDCDSSPTAATAAENCIAEGDYTAYRTAYLNYQKAVRMQAVVDSACYNGNYDCSNGKLSNSGGSYAYFISPTNNGETRFHMLNPTTGVVADAVNVDLTWVYRESATVNQAALTSTYSTEEGTWQTMYEDLAKKLKDYTVAEARYWAYEASWEIHDALITTGENSEDALKTTRDQKVDLLDAADAQVQAATKRVAMATEDLADEVATLDALQATLVAAEEAHAVEVYLLARADEAALVQSEIVASWSEVCGDEANSTNCSDALTNLQTLHTTATDNFNDVQDALNCTSFDFDTMACSGFYKDRYEQAVMAHGITTEILADAEEAVLDHGAALAWNTRMLTEAIDTCKGLGYDKAQAAKKKLMDLEADNEAAAAEVATDYAAKSAFADTGETNTLCAYPAKDAAGTQEPRPECQDGYCCGAAQKFLKDGTKLAIETCQKAEGVHTYDYYPPLPEGSPVEPTPETWRFQCISGAQKLAATAAAALAASYMMA